jgi:hypothetical protein
MPYLGCHEEVAVQIWVNLVIVVTATGAWVLLLVFRIEALGPCLCVAFVQQWHAQAVHFCRGNVNFKLSILLLSGTNSERMLYPLSRPWWRSFPQMGESSEEMSMKLTCVHLNRSASPKSKSWIEKAEYGLFRFSYVVAHTYCMSSINDSPLDDCWQGRFSHCTLPIEE